MSTVAYEACGLAIRREPDYCRACQAVPLRVHHDQPALFHHGGYGATARTHVDLCRCGSRVVAVETVRPDRG